MEILISIYVAIIILVAVSMWTIYTKAGKPGWAVLIPFYNIIVFMQIIKKPWWWLFLWMIPYLNFIWIIWGWNLLVKKFGKSEGFTVGIIFLGPVFIPILAFGSAKYLDLQDSTASAQTEEAAYSKNSDAIILIVIIYMLFTVLVGVLLRALIRDWYQPPGRYFQIAMNIIWGFIPVLLGVAIRNKTMKIVGIILGSLYAVYIIYNNIQWLLQ